MWCISTCLIVQADNGSISPSGKDCPVAGVVGYTVEPTVAIFKVLPLILADGAICLTEIPEVEDVVNGLAAVPIASS